MAGNLLNVSHSGGIQFFSIRIYNGFRDRMVGILFRVSGQLQKLLLRNLFREAPADCKRAFCQRTRLIKDNRLCSSKRFQIVAAFDQYAAFGSAADSAEETERYRDNQCTGT